MPIQAELTHTHELIALEEQYGAHNYHPLDVVIERAEGVWVYDIDGKRYLDCLASYSAVNQGHCHPRILETLIEQAHKVTLTSRAFRNDQLPLLYRDLHELTGFDMALPSFMKHIHVLEESGLVQSEKSGRVRTCRLSPDALLSAEDWFQHQRAIWETRLDRFEAYVMKLKKERAVRQPSKSADKTTKKTTKRKGS